jgi:hypothetical protein
MAGQELDKVVAAQALEAAKVVLQHLQKWAVQLEQRGEEKPRELSQLYGKVRRIRDYLTRGMGAHMATVELDLTDDDRNVLASCLVFSLHGVGMELRYAKGLAPHDRAWLEEKRQTLSDLAVDLATEDVKIIPSPGTTKQPVAVVRMVMDRVRKKIRGGGTETTTGGMGATRPGGVRPGGPGGAGGGGAGMPGTMGAPWTQKTEQPADQAGEGKPKRKIQTGAWTDAWSGHRNPLPPIDGETPTAEVESPPVSQSDPGTGGFSPTLRSPATTGPQTPRVADTPVSDEQASDTESSTPRFGRRKSDLDDLKAGVKEEQEQRELEEALQLDSRLVRDPRLRTMIVLDLRALERARAAKDYRLSAVHLCSVCEAVVVDVALTKREKVKLKGTPETWRLDEVIKALLGDRFTTSDRASLFHLVACRNLIRPSVQLHNPIVVTRATLKKMVEFVQRLLVEMGVAGSGTGTLADQRKN